MGQAKQIIILTSLLLLQSVFGFCFEESFQQSFPGDINNKLEKLQIYFETEMYDQANAVLDELIAQFPDEPRFKYLRAIVDYQSNNCQRASEVFTEFIDKYPQVAEPYYLLGEIHLKEGDKDKAREYFIKYSELAPEDTEVLNKIGAITADTSSGVIIVKDGKGNAKIVEKIGFYGARVSVQQGQAIKLINGNFRNWSSMGIDFVYPVDLRGRQITLKLKGKQGGEKLELTFRDKFAQDYTPQLVLAPEEKSLSSDWQKMEIALGEHGSKIDLSSIVHMGFEFGSSTVRNPAQSTIFVKDIVIDDARN